MSPIEIILIGAITTLTGAIVFFFGLEQNRHKETKQRLEECERVRNNTAARVARLEAGCVLTRCPLRMGNREKENPNA